ncbi:MAG: WHG domain-containing protein [Myxococcota bacterium]
MSVKKTAGGRGVGQHHGDLRAALLREALVLLAAGDAEFSLRALARAAGVSPAAPYHHFGDKRGLLAALAAEGFAALGAALDELREGHQDPALAVMVARYVDFAVEHSAHYRLMFHPGIAADGGPVAMAARAAFARLVRAVRQTAPDIDAVEATSRAGLVWSLAHGTAELAAQGAFDKLGQAHGLAQRAARAAVLIARG